MVPLKEHSLIAQKAQLAWRKILHEFTGELSEPFMGQLLVKQLEQSAFVKAIFAWASMVAIINNPLFATIESNSSAFNNYPNPFEKLWLYHWFQLY